MTLHHLLIVHVDYGKPFRIKFDSGIVVHSYFQIALPPLSYHFETAIIIFCNVYEYTFQMIPHTFGHLVWYRPTPVAQGLISCIKFYGQKYIYRLQTRMTTFIEF